MHTYVYIFMTVIVFNSVLLTLNPCVNKTFFLFFCLFEIPFLSICLNLSKFCRTEAVETYFFLKLSRIRSDASDPFRCLEPIQIPWTRSDPLNPFSYAATRGIFKRIWRIFIFCSRKESCSEFIKYTYRFQGNF